jgi:hypothetical protein
MKITRKQLNALIKEAITDLGTNSSGIGGAKSITQNSANFSSKTNKAKITLEDAVEIYDRLKAKQEPTGSDNESFSSFSNRNIENGRWGWSKSKATRDIKRFMKKNDIKTKAKKQRNNDK